MSQDRKLMFDPLGGITIVVQDEDKRVLGWVKREGTLWRATNVTGRDMGLFANPHVAVINLASSSQRFTGTR